MTLLENLYQSAYHILGLTMDAECKSLYKHVKLSRGTGDLYFDQGCQPSPYFVYTSTKALVRQCNYTGSSEPLGNKYQSFTLLSIWV